MPIGRCHPATTAASTPRRFLLSALAVLLVGLAGPVRADSQQTLRFDIPSQPVARALEVYARQAKVEFLIPYEALDGIVSAPVKGEFDRKRALQLLLKNTGLEANFRADGAVQITHAASAASARTGDEQAVSSKDLRLAQSASQASSSDDRQNSAAASGRQDESSRQPIQEVIVTATKRAENVQDVPLSIAVVTADDIDRRGLMHSEDYLRGIPGVNQVGDAYGQTIAIRGIESSPAYQNFGSGATTATYFGETPTTSSGGYDGTNVDIKLVDIERVEVLRGPQGTTFGSSAMGGAVRTIPVAPKLDRYEAKVGALYSVTSGTGSDNNLIQAVGNLPLVEGRFAVRAVAYRGEDSGIYRNVAGSDAAFQAAAASYGAQAFAVNKDDVGGYYFHGGRISALFQATDDLKFTVGYLKQRTEVDGSPISNRPGYDQVVYQAAAGATDRGESGGLTDHDLDIANATVEYKFGRANLLATYSYLKSGTVESVSDSVDEVSPRPRSSLVRFDQRAHIGEVRLTTQLDGAWNFLAGLYAEDIKDDGTYYRYWDGNPAANPLAPGFGGLTNTYADARGLKQNAAFGEISWKFLPGFTLTGGVRAYQHDRDGVVDTFAARTNSGVHSEVSGKASGSTFRGNLSYKPNENAMLYATWSQGFRLGKPQEGAPADTCDLNNDGVIDNTNITIASTRELRSDDVDNTEIGGKFAFFDRRMTLDAGVFRMKWTGIPVFYYLPPFPITCGYAFNANAGKALSEGIESQLSFRVTRALRVDAGASWIDAHITEDVPSLGAIAGARLPGSPKVNANLGLQYEFQIAGHATSLRTDAVYLGPFYGDLLQSTGVKAGDYIKIDASARMTFGQLNFDLFVRNLTDRDDFSWRGAYLAGDHVGYHLRPRTIGLQLGYDF